MPYRPTVLLVMPGGPTRKGARSALTEAGFDVTVAAEPYAATVAFAERPSDLVVLDLGSFRPRDRAFLRVVRRRSPRVRVLLLLPEGRRRLAVTALEAGADAYVLEPFHPGELAAVARGLLRGRAEGDLGGDPTALIRLAREVAHAVNNPLQVLSLAAETPSGPRGAAPDPAVRETVGRIRDVVGLLQAYGRLGPPQRQPVDLGRLLRGTLEVAGKAGLVRVVGRPPPDGPEGSADAGQVREALGGVLAALAARAASPPAAVSARVRSGRRRHVLQVLARGLTLDEAERALFASSVLTSDEQTRRPLPGLALPAAIARLHGGRLEVSGLRLGLVVGVRLPK